MLSILLPTDFSKNSINAVKYALEFYKDENCKFHFLHCYPPVIFSYEYQIEKGLVGKNIHEIIQAETKDKLYDLAFSLMRDHGNGQEFYVEVVKGFLPDQIARVTSDNKIDIIVMGTKGETGSDRVVFGTNTIQVINKRCCPVIAIPEGYEFQGVENILFPSDLNISFTQNHLKHILKTLELHQSKIDILHISYRGLNSTQRKHKAILEETFSKDNIDFVIKDSRDITDIIYNYQQYNKSELLIMINNKHMFFENLFFKPTISKIAMHLSTPFLVIPA